MVRKYADVHNILSKAIRSISLNINCADKRSQNLQISEFIKARVNSNIQPKLPHSVKMARNISLKEIVQRIGPKICKNLNL